MKDLIPKLVAFITSLKGKKPAVMAIVAVIFILVYFAVQKGYIAEGTVDMNFVISQVESLFHTDTAKATIDTLAKPIVDSLPK